MMITQTGQDNCAFFKRKGPGFPAGFNFKTLCMYHAPRSVYYTPRIEPECFDTIDEATTFAFDNGRRMGAEKHPLIKDVVCQGTQVNGLPSFVVFKQYHMDDDATRYFCVLM